MTDGTPVTKNLEENEVWFRSRCEGCSDIKLQPMRLGKDGSVSALAIYVENTVPLSLIHILDIWVCPIISPAIF